MNSWDLVGMVETTTQEQCRDLGNLLLELADQPRDAKWKAFISMTRSQMETPEQRTIASAIEAGNRRVEAASDALRADGMDHRTLIEAELARRGDGRTFEHFRNSIGAISSNVA
ncbi:hypothetical protein [Sphingobium limneticum]|uniref:Uncharacterized protein n=1 Tax=Sphingobium limneticum TaxID=1007511 RepID=A0A5J5I8Z6_9SPHN|nr:hypothetical protein [Sphingobium limneticum]KAA9019837.1 hypothetical protein F4U96_06270 [Sphingobium limneticum]KAA9032295.1 hypothetical protein F4U95_06270 [Sphingobium limneticum]